MTPFLFAATQTDKLRFGGIAFILIGLYTLVFGGTTDAGTHIRIFGMDFGRRDPRPMSKGASLFWGLACLIGGIVMIVCSRPSANVWPS